MSRRQKIQVSAAAVAVVVVASAAFLASARRVYAPEAPDRVIVLSAKGYAFHDSTAPAIDNPPLRLRAGERVRVVLRNEEKGGVEHNFKIPGLDVRCSKKVPAGEEGAVEFTVPKDGLYTYTCCSHPGMGGAVQIEGAGGDGAKTAAEKRP
jgi:plastocyanin